jgi:hypothetical protein
MVALRQGTCSRRCAIYMLRPSAHVVRHGRTGVSSRGAQRDNQICHPLFSPPQGVFGAADGILLFLFGCDCARPSPRRRPVVGVLVLRRRIVRVAAFSGSGVAAQNDVLYGRRLPYETSSTRTATSMHHAVRTVPLMLVNRSLAACCL